MYITERLTINNVTGTSSAGETGAASGVGTTTVFQTNLTAINDYFNGMTIRFTSGANSGESRAITDYALANGTVTVGVALTAAPAAADAFIIEPINTRFQTDLVAVDDFYNGMEIEFTSGPCKGQQATILDYIQDGGLIILVTADALSRVPEGSNTFIIWTGLNVDGAVNFDLPITSRFCKIVYIGIVQLQTGPVQMNFEIWESTTARSAPDHRPNFYQKILNRKITMTVLQGGEYGESLSGDPMPYFDRDAVDEDATYRLHCRIDNDITAGTASDFAVTVKIADMGENV